MPFVAEHKVAFAVVAVVLLTAMNLRGIRESGTAFAIPTYAFMVVIVAMIIWGLVRIFAASATRSAGGQRRPDLVDARRRLHRASRSSSCCCARSPRAARR